MTPNARKLMDWLNRQPGFECRQPPDNPEDAENILLLKQGDRWICYLYCAFSAKEHAYGVVKSSNINWLKNKKRRYPWYVVFQVGKWNRGHLLSKSEHENARKKHYKILRPKTDGYAGAEYSREAVNSAARFRTAKEFLQILEWGYTDIEERKAKVTDPDEVFDLIARRRGQKKFRAALLTKFGKCIITGSKCEAVLEACHIKPYAETRQHEVDNGLLLRSDIHTLFDLGLVAINPKTMTIWVNSRIAEHVKALKIKSGSTIKVPRCFSTKEKKRWNDALSYHWSNRNRT